MKEPLFIAHVLDDAVTYAVNVIAQTAEDAVRAVANDALTNGVIASDGDSCLVNLSLCLGRTGVLDKVPMGEYRLANHDGHINLQKLKEPEESGIFQTLNLCLRREQAAEQAWDLHDFGPETVKNQCSWSVHEEYAQRMFDISNTNGVGTQKVFVVRFVPGTAEVSEAYIADPVV